MIILIFVKDTREIEIANRRRVGEDRRERDARRAYRKGTLLKKTKMSIKMNTCSW